MSRSIKEIFLVLIFLGLPMPAVAAAYKCKMPDGSVSFQQIPCEGGQQEEINIRPPHRDTYNAMRLEMDTLSKTRKRDHDDEVAKAIHDGRVIPGMTEQDVAKSLGEPNRVNDNGGHMQWVYDSRRGDTYVYFENGLTR